MAPRSLGYKQLQQRMRRSLCYGSRRMRSLSLPLSELLVDYFDKYAPYDYMDMDFATSLARESCVDACTFLVAMVYMDRLRRADKQFFETTDPNEMYLSALVVASKYLHDGGLDEFVYNDEWAASSDRSTKRVNELELKLLDSLSWNINVRNTEFTRILDQVECWIARQSIFKRGFATYNEVKVLSDDPKFILDTLKSLVTILATITVIYSTFAISILLIPHLATSVNSTRPYNVSILSTQKIAETRSKLPMRINNAFFSRPSPLLTFNQLTSDIFELWQFSSISSRLLDLKTVFGLSDAPVNHFESSFDHFNMLTKSVSLGKFLTDWDSKSGGEHLSIMAYFNRSTAFHDAIDVFKCSFV